MSEITPNTPNPVREDTLMKKIMDALGGDYVYATDITFSADAADENPVAAGS